MPSESDKLDQRARQFVVAIILGLFLTRVLAETQPLWGLALFLVIVGVVGGAIVMALRARRRRRDRAWNGLCLHCGYDVRAVEGPRCPECGKPSRRVEPAPDDQPGPGVWMNQPPAVSEPMKAPGPMLTVHPPPKAQGESGNAGSDGAAGAEKRA